MEILQFPPVLVSTHSRLKAAAVKAAVVAIRIRVSTHSRLKAAVHGGRRKVKMVKFQHTAA